jgi:hypothetical protein
MFFKSFDNGESATDWWASARLYRGSGKRRRLLMQAPLADLVVAAGRAAPAVQVGLSIEVEPDGVILWRDGWQLLAKRHDFPVFI